MITMTHPLELHRRALDAVPAATEPITPIDWAGSPFEGLSSGAVGAYGELLVAEWAVAREADVEDAEDSVFDLRIDGRRAEVKTCRPYNMRGGRPFYCWYAIYPHTFDDLYLVALDPQRVRVHRMTAAEAERRLLARHKMTAAAAGFGGADLMIDVDLP